MMCLLALEPQRSSILAVMVAFFKVRLVPGVGKGPGGSCWWPGITGLGRRIGERIGGDRIERGKD